MELKVGDEIELTNGSKATITLIGETLEGYTVYGVGNNSCIS